MKFRLFGDRVLLQRVPVRQGMILVPENKDTTYRLGRVLAVGDGTRPGQKPIAMYLKVDDLCFFQFIENQQAHSMYQKDRETVFINLAQSEVVARVDDDDVTLEKFHILGDWVLLRAFSRDQSLIVIPEIHQAALRVNYVVLDKGGTVDLDMKQGDEVVMYHGAAHHLKLGSEEVVFINKGFIHGVVEEKEEAADAVLAPQAS